MIRLLCAVLLALSLAAPAHAEEPTAHYDLLFKEGTLDDLREGESLRYAQEVFLRGEAETSAAATGAVELRREPDDMAALTYRKGEGQRRLGQFPATVGNPMIMYFMEAVIRDMGGYAGGSPFYIRNRVKDSLTRPAAIETEGETARVTLRPFDGDPNADRMRGFDDLTLTVEMSPDAAGWYRRLNATASDEEGEVYHRRLTLETPQ